MPVKILLADDHPVFLGGLVTLLEKEKDFQIKARVSDGNAVMHFLHKTSCDVCILDINMPGKDGIETVKEIRRGGSKVKIIILTTYNDIQMIKALLSYDISGYVLKNSTGQELVQAIRKVMNGGNWFSAEVQEAITQDVINSEKRNGEPKVILTPREIEIIKLLAKENTNEEIADKLFISYRTVETHRKNIMQKTGAKNLAGLITYAMSQGILK